MRVLLTGISGYVGGTLVAPLQAAGHDVVGLARDPSRVTADVEVRRGDLLTGDGLDAAMAGCDVAYFPAHAMEGSTDGFADRELRMADAFVTAATRADVGRLVYLGGLVNPAFPSPHLSSRLAVETRLLSAEADVAALRASIVIGTQSRSFRFLVRLVERVPLVPLAPWARFRTQPIDERDIIAILATCATSSALDGQQRSLDAVGPDVVAYGELIEAIADAMMVARPRLNLPFDVPALAAPIAAAIAGEDVGLIAPLMGSLGNDLLPREDPQTDAAAVLGVTPHRLSGAVSRALRQWEAAEPLAAR